MTSNYPRCGKGISKLKHRNNETNKQTNKRNLGKQASKQSKGQENKERNKQASQQKANTQTNKQANKEHESKQKANRALTRHNTNHPNNILRCPSLAIVAWQVVKVKVLEVANPAPKDKNRMVQCLQTMRLVWLMHPKGVWTPRFDGCLNSINLLNWWHAVVCQKETRFPLDDMINLHWFMAMRWIVDTSWKIKHTKHRILIFIHDAVPQWFQCHIHALRICQAWIPRTWPKRLGHSPQGWSIFHHASQCAGTRMQKWQQLPTEALHWHILCLQPEMGGACPQICAGVKPVRNLLMSKVEKTCDGFWLGFYIINEHEGSIATPRLDFSQWGRESKNNLPFDEASMYGHDTSKTTSVLILIEYFWQLLDFLILKKDMIHKPSAPKSEPESQLSAILVHLGLDKTQISWYG